MKIAFLGDSITEGFPGVSFINLIQSNLLDDELLNYGKGGDTVSSLFRRVKKMKDLDAIDAFVLFIGVNDVYSKITTKYKLLKIMRRQVWAKDIKEFERQYLVLLDKLLSYGKQVIVIPPLLIGEDLDNKWNLQLYEYTKIIEQLCTNQELVTYINVRKEYIDKLENKEVSEFLPFSISEVFQDVIKLDTIEKIDEMSKERGLHLTLDGIHINSKGATILANAISTKIQKLK